jgi:hypothetical protein
VKPNKKGILKENLGELFKSNWQWQDRDIAVSCEIVTFWEI